MSNLEGKKLIDFEAERRVILPMSFSPDSKNFAFLKSYNNIQLWNFSKQKIIKFIILEAGECCPHELQFDSDGKILFYSVLYNAFSNLEKYIIKLYKFNEQTMREIGTKSITSPVSYFNFTINNKNQTIVIFLSQNLSQRGAGEFELLFKSIGHSITFSTDGKILGFITEDEAIKLFNI